VTTPVTLSGEIDVASVVHQRAMLYKAIDERPGAVVDVDLREVSFIDSTGLGILVGALRRARGNGGDLRLTRPPADLWKVFTVTGLDRVLPFSE